MDIFLLIAGMAMQWRNPVTVTEHWLIEPVYDFFAYPPLASRQSQMLILVGD